MRHGASVVLRHAGKQKARVAPARTGGDMVALKQDGVDVATAQDLKEGHAGDPTADDDDVGPRGQGGR
jgi:hypothetical protein